MLNAMEVQFLQKLQPKCFLSLCFMWPEYCLIYSSSYNYFHTVKKKVSRTLKLFTVKLHRVFIEIPPEERAGEWMNSHLCLILFIWRQALNKQEKSWLTHIIIFSLFKAVLKFYQFFLKPQFMEKTNYFKNTRRKYPDNSILESDILEKRFPECTLSSLKGALLKVPTGYYYFLLREVD